MKRLGFKYTKSLPGHQDCLVCHPAIKSGKAKDRRGARREMQRQVKP